MSLSCLLLEGISELLLMDIAPNNYTAVLLLVVLVFAGVIVAAEGAAPAQVDTTCLKQLVPCLNYLNGTRHPPENCCNPLKWVIKSNPECLCSMISNRGTKEAEEAGININEAQQLPARCGQHVNPISCLSTASPDGSKNTVPNSANSFSLLSRASMAMGATALIIATCLF